MKYQDDSSILLKFTDIFDALTLFLRYMYDIDFFIFYNVQYTLCITIADSSRWISKIKTARVLDNWGLLPEKEAINCCFNSTVLHEISVVLPRVDGFHISTQFSSPRTDIQTLFSTCEIIRKFCTLRELHKTAFEIALYMVNICLLNGTTIISTTKSHGQY